MLSPGLSRLRVLFTSWGERIGNPVYFFLKGFHNIYDHEFSKQTTKNMFGFGFFYYLFRVERNFWPFQKLSASYHDFNMTSGIGRIEIMNYFLIHDHNEIMIHT